MSWSLTDQLLLRCNNASSQPLVAVVDKHEKLRNSLELGNKTFMTLTFNYYINIIKYLI